jgi:hypothetical protein
MIIRKGRFESAIPAAIDSGGDGWSANNNLQ